VVRVFLLWLACVLAPAVTASADIYRCEEPDGSVRFADDPALCPGAQRVRREPREKESREQEGGAPAPRAGSAQGEAGVQPEEAAVPDLRLEGILPPAAAVAGRWEVVDEVPADLADDPDFLRWGVRATVARHYTRSDDSGVQVCSVEIWIFEDATRARLALENFRYPDWYFERQEHFLIMLHAVTTRREGPPRRGLFAECRQLGAQTSVRAATRLRR
jgi:hypothetical protein